MPSISASIPHALNFEEAALKTAFSGKETETMMRVTKIEDLPEALRAKVEDSDLSALYPVLPRNLRLLLEPR